MPGESHLHLFCNQDSQQTHAVKLASAPKEWAAKYDEIAAEQRALAQELTELYPPFEAKIVDLLLRIEKADIRRRDRL